MGYGLYSCTQGVNEWAGESIHWSPGSNDWNPMAGHFSQIVWKSTTHVGCGWADCAGKGPFEVCHYLPNGEWCSALLRLPLPSN